MPKILLPIPENSKLEVKVGDKVEIGDLLAVVKERAELKVLELAKLLGVSPQKARRLLILSVGSRVEKGQMLAKKQNLLGLSKTFVFSPISGKISFFDDKTGKLFIREKSEERVEIKSKLTGKILAIDEDGLKIETENETFFGKIGFGPEIEGELVFPTLLDRKIRDKILGVETLGRLTLSKAFGLGVRGAITTSISDEDLTYLKERNFQFSFLLVAKDEFENLKTYAGRQALLFPEEKMLVIL